MDSIRLELACLEHLIIYIDSGERSSSFFRTLIDNWNAYHRGGHFLNRNGGPHWFNRVTKKDRAKLAPALEQMDIVSPRAAAILDGRVEGVIVKDHAIPSAFIRDRMLAERPSTPDQIREFLLSWYRLGVITEDEHKLLDDRDCRHTMPPGWNGAPGFARYVYAGIERSRGRRKLDDSFA